jgi:hypothetical protein
VTAQLSAPPRSASCDYFTLIRDSRILILSRTHTFFSIAVRGVFSGSVTMLEFRPIVLRE